MKQPKTTKHKVKRIRKPNKFGYAAKIARTQGYGPDYGRTHYAWEVLVDDKRIGLVVEMRYPFQRDTRSGLFVTDPDCKKVLSYGFQPYHKRRAAKWLCDHLFG